ncbi:histidine phosphatase family protein [Komagataeibacter rhaeticus]|nr:histidine phosphatase family protein [Komagataeibacter rhaeticus]
MVAERVAQFMNLELRVDSRLREISFGEWEGRPWNRISRTALDAWAADVSGFTSGGKRGRAAGPRAPFLEGHAGRRPALRGDYPWGPLRLMQGMVHGGPGSLLAPSPPLGSVRVVEQRNPLFTTGRSEPRIPSRLPLHQERRRSVRQAATVQGGT